MLVGQRIWPGEPDYCRRCRTMTLHSFFLAEFVDWHCPCGEVHEDEPAWGWSCIRCGYESDAFTKIIARWAAQGIKTSSSDVPAATPAKPSPRQMADEVLRRGRERGDATKPRERAPIRTDGVDPPDAPRHGDGPLDPARRTQRRRESQRRQGFPPQSIVAGAHAWSDGLGHTLVDNTEAAQRELAKLRRRYPLPA